MSYSGHNLKPWGWMRVESWRSLFFLISTLHFSNYGFNQLLFNLQFNHPNRHKQKQPFPRGLTLFLRLSAKPVLLFIFHHTLQTTPHNCVAVLLSAFCPARNAQRDALCWRLDFPLRLGVFQPHQPRALYSVDWETMRGETKQDATPSSVTSITFPFNLVGRWWLAFWHIYRTCILADGVGGADIRRRDSPESWGQMCAADNAMMKKFAYSSLYFSWTVRRSSHLRCKQDPTHFIYFLPL